MYISKYIVCKYLFVKYISLYTVYTEYMKRERET